MLWRILQRPWWSGPQLHSPLGIHRWGRINDLSYLFASSLISFRVPRCLHNWENILCTIFAVFICIFFAGLKCCMLPMLQVMLSETNIDINAKFESKSPAKSVSRLFALRVCRVSMRAIGSVCRMSYICPKSSGLKVVQFTKTLDPAIGR